MDQPKYVKLKDLIDDEFTVEKVWGYNWQMWDQAEGRMIRSDEYKKGFQKKYQVDTDKGKLDLSQSQIGSMLAGVLDPKAGGAQIEGATFTVKSNGKSGMDIRYFINPARKTTEKPKPVYEDTTAEFEESDFV